MWIILSVLGAIFQATGMAVKKKALQIKGSNNFIAFASFTFAGILLGGYLLLKGGQFPEIINPYVFWQGMFWMVFLNILAIFFLYKALDASDLSYLMPFMTLTSLFIIVPPIFTLGEIPSVYGFFGIVLIVTGAITMEYKSNRKRSFESEHEKEKSKSNRKGLMFFLITAACYTITPTAIKIVVVESNAIFASFLSLILIGISFLPLVFIFKEQNKIKEIFSTSSGHKNFFVSSLLFAGFLIAAEGLSINSAMSLTKVSYVMAIKRTMPIFAFLIGFFFFKEKINVKRKLLAIILMVLGAVFIATFN